MKYLLDTHVFLWMLLHTDKLSKKVYNVLEDSGKEIYLSAISLWEIAIKHQLRKLDLGGVDIRLLPNVAAQSDVKIITPITAPEIFPIPPLKEIPPTTQAAIASSSYPCPVPAEAFALNASKKAPQP